MSLEQWLKSYTRLVFGLLIWYIVSPVDDVDQDGTTVARNGYIGSGPSAWLVRRSILYSLMIYICYLACHSWCFLARQRNSRLQAENVMRQATWIERPATRTLVPILIYEYQVVSIVMEGVR